MPMARRSLKTMQAVAPVWAAASAAAAPDVVFGANGPTRNVVIPRSRVSSSKDFQRLAFDQELAGPPTKQTFECPSEARCSRDWTTADGVSITTVGALAEARLMVTMGWAAADSASWASVR